MRIVSFAMGCGFLTGLEGQFGACIKPLQRLWMDRVEAECLEAFLRAGLVEDARDHKEPNCEIIFGVEDVSAQC
jgi:hypothetical protein